MIRRPIPFILAILCIFASGFPLLAADQGALDASEQLFTVLAAANAAGYDAGLATSPPLRQQVRDSVSATNATVIRQLQAWYKEHRELDKTQDLARFLSLGISVKGPPDFEWSKREVEVPPDAMAMDDFRKLLPRFYEDAKIGDLWKRSQKSVDAMLDRYQEPVTHAVLEVNSYIRKPSNEYLGRHFEVLFDFLSAPNQVQTRSYGDDYFVVLTPSSDLHISEIRHAYFRFAIDPLAFKYGMELKAKASLMDIAEGAPLLTGEYRSDFGLLATECLIKAIESRLNSNPSMVDQALREGFILTPFFNEQLAIYEKQPESMKLFFPQMVQSLSVKHEIRRLENVQFATELPHAPARQVEVINRPAESAAAQTITRADAFYYDKQDLASARKLYEQALEQPGSATEHSRAYYGLAHVALRQKDPEKADQLFRKTLESSPDPETQAWSCYYLGKLSVVAAEQDEAMKWFQQAVAIKGASPKALESSRQELAKLGAVPK